MSNKVIMDTESASALRELLTTIKYEVIPLKNVMAQIDALPENAVVTVTASPAKGPDATIELSEILAARGLTVIPHLSARMTPDRAYLQQTLRRLEEAGITRAFVVGGDHTEPGEYFDALSLLQAMADLDHNLTEIGIGCYPEGHPEISDEQLLQALHDKSPYAAYMTTQMCFDPDVITEWIDDMRNAGIELPVHIGLPGVAALHKLISISARIGIGDSTRFLAKNTSLVGRFVRPGGYAPDELLARLAPTVLDEAAAIESLHMYSFNQVESTERWRHELLESLDEIIAD